MDPEESIYLGFATDYLNEQVLKGQPVDTEGVGAFLLRDFLSRIAEIAPEWGAYSSRMAISHKVARVRHMTRVRRGILKRLGAEFRDFEYFLAAAEAVSQELSRSIANWLRADRDRKNSPLLLGQPGSLGGPSVRALLLISMHGKMVTYASEIELLLRSGFIDGAASRMRTLYEAATKALLIVFDKSSDAILANRFCVSAIYELERKGESLDPEQEALKGAAIAAWGDRFFKGEHNWAAPAVQASSANVSFRDIEMAVGMDDMRDVYVHGNEAVHAGPLGMIGNSTLHSGVKRGRRDHLAETRPSVDPYTTAVIAQSTVYILSEVTVVVGYTLFSEFKEWDDVFAMSKLHEIQERLKPALAKVAKRYVSS